MSSHLSADHPLPQQPAGQPMGYLDGIDRAVIALAMLCTLVVVGSDGALPVTLGLAGVIASITYFAATAVEAFRREVTRNR